MRSFWVLCFGRIVALAGSSLSGFALGVWVYKQSGSVVDYTFLSFFTNLPGLLVAPVAGAIVDRVNRRRLLMGCAVGSLCNGAVLALAYALGALRIELLYATSLFGSCLSVLDWLAFSALTTQMVPASQLGRAGGVAQAGSGVARLGAPLAAGYLLGQYGLGPVLVLDLAGFLLGLISLAFVQPPLIEKVSARPDVEGFKAQLAEGWAYLRGARGLRWLLAYFAFINALVTTVNALTAPMVLELGSVGEAARVYTASGVGLLLGGVTMSVWGGPKRRVGALVRFVGLAGVAVAVAGCGRRLPVVAAMAFTFYFLQPLAAASSQALWQALVRPELQGRVFALRHMIALTTTPLAGAAAGPLAEYVFEPFMGEGRLGAAVLGSLVGVGRGRGVGLLVALSGVLMTLLSVAAIRLRALRGLDDEPIAAGVVAVEGASP